MKLFNNKFRNFNILVAQAGKSKIKPLSSARGYLVMFYSHSAAAIFSSQQALTLSPSLSDWEFSQGKNPANQERNDS